MCNLLWWRYAKPSTNALRSGDYTVDHTTMLTHVLKLHFGWHLARIKCLSCLIVASFQVKTVNFVELATAFSGSAKVDSHYRRIQRFFKEIQLQQDAIARFVVSLLPYDQFVLSMDSSFYPWTAPIGCSDALRSILSASPSSIRGQLFLCSGYCFPRKEIPIRRNEFNS